MKKVKFVFLLVFVSLMTLASTSSVQAAKREKTGDLDLNTQALYDDGQGKQKNQKSYDVPDLFLKEKSASNQKIKARQNDAVNTANKYVFLHPVKNKNYESRDERVLDKYLFTSKFHGAQVVGIEHHQASWWRRNSEYLLIIILACGVLVLGIYLGIKFPDFLARLHKNIAEKQSGKKRSN